MRTKAIREACFRAWELRALMIVGICAVVTLAALSSRHLRNGLAAGETHLTIVRPASAQPSWLKLKQVSALRTNLNNTGLHGRSMAAADFDEDGVEDLLAGYVSDTGGVLLLHRGDPQSFSNPETARFIAGTQFVDLQLPPDFLAAGDFNADGHYDAVIATRGGDTLLFLRGDGKGQLSFPETIHLPGVVSELVAGDVNRRDGLTDLLIAIESRDGARLLVFEHASGALQETPETLSLKETATSVAVGQLDDDMEIDYVVGMRHQIAIFAGRDRKTSSSAEVRDSVKPPQVTIANFDRTIDSIAAGDFIGDHRWEIAAITSNGSINLINREVLLTNHENSPPTFVWQVDHSATLQLNTEANSRRSLIRTKVSSQSRDDLVVLDHGGGQLQVITDIKGDSPTVAASFTVNSGLSALLPLRVGVTAVYSLVALGRESYEPTILQPQTGATITVNTIVDNNVRDSVLTLDEAIRVANGTLAVATLTASEQAQVSGTPSNPGLDQIHFNISGSGVPKISVTGTLPTVSDPVIINGTTQPGAARVEVYSPDASYNFLITSGSSTVRGMVLNGAGAGVELQTGGNNIVEGNFIGTSPDGTAASTHPNTNQVLIDNSANNTVGGTTPAARNILSAGIGASSEGVDIRGAASTGNLIVGNYIGTNVTGTVAIGNRDNGVFLFGAPNNTIGGTTAGAGNVIAGINSTSGAGVEVGSGSTGTLIQGNFIGLDKDGVAALNSRGYGVILDSSSTLGGTSPAARNVVSGNGRDGVYLGANNLLVQGNYIGTNAAGTSPVPNSEHGVNMTTLSNNTVGGSVSGARNVISGNLFDGVNLADTSGDNPNGNRIQGNFIGTDVTGTLPVPNQGDGVDLFDVDNTLVGGPLAEERNVISGNRLNGIEVTPANNGYLNPTRIEGNFIGTNAFGTGSLGNGAHGIFFTNNGNGMVVGGTTTGTENRIAFNGGDGISTGGSTSAFVVQGNSISLNNGLGFDRGDNGPDANQSTLTRNSPVLTSVTTNGNTTTVVGTLQQNHATSISYLVQFFANDSCDPSGFGEGGTFAGQTNLQITSNLPVNFTVPISPSVSGSKFLTAIAIGQSSTTAGLLTTSEFSACLQVSEVTPTPTPTPTPSPTPTPTPVPPSIFVIAPNRGGNAGSVTSRITGQGFQQGVQVSLKRTGEADIVAGLVHVDAVGGSLTATFDLFGKSIGTYDVVVTNPGAASAMLPAAFTVESGGGADVWADLMGRLRNRINTNARFFIMVGNRGNTDAYHVPVFLAGLPSNATVKVEYEVLTPPTIPNAEPVDFNAIPTTSGNETGRLVPVIVPRLRPGQVIALPITVRAPDTSQVTLSVWASQPMVSSLSFLPAGPSSTNKYIRDGKQIIARLNNVLTPELINCLAAIIKFAASEVLGALLGDSCVDLVKQILLNELPNFLGNAVGLAAADDGFGEGFSLTQIFTQLIQIGLKSALCAANIVLPQARLVALALEFANIAAKIETAIEICDACFDNFCSRLIKNPILTMVAAVDPNEKVGPQGVGSEHYITGLEPLPYSIFFENLSTATAPAQSVTITDQLDMNKFDLSTFRFGDVFFGSTQVDVPEVQTNFTLDKDLRPGRNIIVRINGQLNQNTGLITWTFVSLDPATGLPVTDPDEGFLPPNVNSPEGDGAVLFTVSSKTALQVGAQVRNDARIVFDENAAIDTPVWLNTIDNSRPSSSVASLQASQPFVVFDVSWSCNDTGSGVKTYRVFVSEDNGPFELWQIDTSAASGLFVGKPGRTYKFYSIARDGAGNEELPKTVAEATTTTPNLVINSIDDPRFFVYQHYLDFLGREPDPGGLNFWTNEISSCGTDSLCTEVKRINVSAAFFLSIEFQETGYLVERVYRAAFGNGLGLSMSGGMHQIQVPIVRRHELFNDMRTIGHGVIVGQGNWQQVLELNKQTFLLAFVQRDAFNVAFPTSMTPTTFVDSLNQTAGNVLSATERSTAISLFSGAGDTTNLTIRAQVLRQVAEDEDLKSTEFNRAFVLMQYIGYLRRNPNDPQDTDYSGYDFWLTKLNQFNGNFVNAEMVKAFILSGEYRGRFGP